MFMNLSIKELEEAAEKGGYKEMLELGKHYVENNQQEKGLALIEKGINGLGDNIPLGYCPPIGMLLAGIKDEKGERILKWQKYALQLFQRAKNDDKFMELLRTQMPQAADGIDEMLKFIKGYVEMTEDMLRTSQSMKDFIENG